jgi:hypothetical protein
MSGNPMELRIINLEKSLEKRPRCPRVQRGRPGSSSELPSSQRKRAQEVRWSPRSYRRSLSFSGKIGSACLQIVFR